MSNRNRSNPFQEMMELHERLSRSFDRKPSNMPVDGDFFSGSWNPAVDVYETPHEVVIQAELPGLLEDDVSITVEDRLLVIRGERQLDPRFNQEQTHRIEREYGSFRRSFRLPASVDVSQISASQHDGVLKIILPRTEESRPRRIEVTRSD